MNRRTSTLLLVLWVVVACGRARTATPAAVGTLERDRIEVGAEAYEPILEILVREGDIVEPGQLLLRLDPRRVDARLARARATVDEAEATLRLATRGPRQELIDEAQARLAGTEGRLAVAQSQLLRFQQLVREEVETPNRLDEYQGRYDEALANRDAALSELAALLEGTTREELDEIRAAIASARAAVAEIEIDRDRLAIRSPVRGRIDALPFELGERPPIGSTVAVIMADHVPYARVHVPASIRAGLQPGAAATVWIDGQAQPYEGRLRMVSTDASFTPYFALTEHDRSRLSYIAEIDLPEARELPTGVPVEVYFESADRGN